MRVAAHIGMQQPRLVLQADALCWVIRWVVLANVDHCTIVVQHATSNAAP
jgi:hypothetical protein